MSNSSGVKILWLDINWIFVPQEIRNQLILNELAEDTSRDRFGPTVQFHTMKFQEGTEIYEDTELQLGRKQYRLVPK